MIDDYNQFMGGVDIADQLRSNYPTHQKSRRTWLPLWFWALDTTITNSYVIGSHFISKTAASSSSRLTHKAFRLLLARSLIQSGWLMIHPPLQGPTPHYRSHITLHTTLPPFLFRTHGDHHQDHQPNMSRSCWYCCYKTIHGDQKKPLVPAWERASVLAQMKISQTGVWCSLCDLPLCKTQNCFHDFHTV